MKKDTIVLVHGAWHGKWCWEKFFEPAFSSKGYKVITFNLPGHDKPGDTKGINKYTLKDYTKALEKVVSELETAPIIIGHSMGGLIVQKYLESNTCKKAALLASTPPFGVINAVLSFMKKGYFYASLLNLNLYKLVNSEEKSSHAFFSKELPKNELKEYTEKMCSESFLAFLNMLEPRVRVKKDLNIPILVLGGENDKIFSEKDNRFTAKKYNADLIMIEDIAHDLMLDINHKKVSDAIINWIEKEPTL
jgi:alpha-beta hydrolase superfamily lysophospholipase